MSKGLLLLPVAVVEVTAVVVLVEVCFDTCNSFLSGAVKGLRKTTGLAGMLKGRYTESDSRRLTLLLASQSCT